MKSIFGSTNSELLTLCACSRQLLWQKQSKPRTFCLAGPRRMLRSSRRQEIFQPPQQGFYSVHAHAVAASQKYFSAIHTSPHLTLAFVNNLILHLLLVLCTAVNVRNKN
jgi:hypothetical protein